MQIHLDPLGGWSGDMFAAACLDAFPEHWPAVEAAIAALGLGPASVCRLVAHRDHTLTGRRFLVAADHPADHHDHSHDHDHDHDHHGSHEPHGHSHDHPHRAWAEIRAALRDGLLAPPVRDHAIGIFTLLARAEAEVHGVTEDAVAFHEVGAVDSIVDIVAAAQLIATIGAERWTASALPLGSGRVRTAHGLLPVPTPATALLMRGFPTIDDGIPGERVTPTGAAIARYLLAGEASASPRPRRLLASGTGFGTRTMPGLSNCLRLLAFDEVDAPGAASAAISSVTSAFAHRELGVITFEVDDQSAEDLAHGLEHIRALPGVHDALQSVAFGKKGRIATHVQVLVAPAELDAVIAACFTETTTIGLRFHLVQGAALPRRANEVEVGGHRLRVKSVTRPDGARTGKTEAADVAGLRGHAARVALRRAGEAAALTDEERDNRW